MLILFNFVFLFPNFSLAFVAKLVLREGSLLEDVATSPNSRDVHDTATFRSDDCSVGLGPEAPAVEVDNKGND